MPEDKKGPAGGPKTQDTKRNEDVDSPELTAGADKHLSDVRNNLFGDNTSSSGGANTPGQQGRDGGEINETTNNPAPSDEAIKGESEVADAEEKTGDKELKKL